MLRICIFATLASISAGSASAATWSHYENVDEMRGTKTVGASMEASANGDANTKLTINIINSSPNSQGVVFQLGGYDHLACKDDLCEIPVRFGDGEVRNQTMSVDKGRRTLFPTNSSAFAAAVAMVKSFFVELPTEDGGRKQFKFEPESAAFPRVYSPQFKVAGIAIGGGIDGLPASFKPAKSGPSVECREAKDVAIGSGSDKVPAARLCFFNSQLYMVFIDAANKTQHSSVAKLLTDQLGSVDLDSYMERWPDNKGKIIDQYTVSATFWPDHKTKGAGQFMIMDKAIADLIPK